LLILLGCRRTEVGGMCWDELDFECAQWTLPASRSKNKQALTLPIMPMARELIEAVPRLVSRNPLFGARGSGFNGWAKLKRGLDEASGVTGWCLHDLRRTFATRLGDIGIQPHIIEVILNHQSGAKAGVAGTYNRSIYVNEVRQALALWEAHITGLLGGERKVLPLAPLAATR
jgi:integrase